MFNFTDTEVYLMHARNVDHANASREINKANATIRQMRNEIATLKRELAAERAKRHAAEFAARRH